MAHKRRVSIRRLFVPLAFAGCLLLAGFGSAKMINTGAIQKTGELHVAEWNVDVVSASSGSMVLDAGGNAQTYLLTVTNDSEVASSYAIKVSNVPAGVKLGLDISSNSDLVTPTGGEATFTNTGGDLSYISPNNTRSHTLTVVAEPTANVTQSGVDMAINVQFVQKDPRP